MDTTKLRDRVLIEMVRKGYGRPGGKKRLAGELGMNAVRFSKALHGHFIDDSFAERILIDAMDYLRSQNGKRHAIAK